MEHDGWFDVRISDGEIGYLIDGHEAAILAGRVTGIELEEAQRRVWILSSILKAKEVKARTQC